MARTAPLVSLSLSIAAAGMLTTPAARGQAFDVENHAEASKAAETETAAPATPPEPDTAAEHDPTERPHQMYEFVGARMRHIIVPKFVLNLFADGGDTVGVFSIGPEYTRRKDDFEMSLALTYADYSMEQTPFKGKKDKEDAWEIVSSDLKVLYATADLMWNFPIDERRTIAFLAGFGAGVGAVFGDLYRAQAYDARGTHNPEDYAPCEGNHDPPVQIKDGAQAGVYYCEHDPDVDVQHWEGYAEPSWANGGSKPFVMPWLALPQFGMRWKPVKEFQARLDLGFSLSGFFWGLGLDYGL